MNTVLKDCQDKFHDYCLGVLAERPFHSPGWENGHRNSILEEKLACWAHLHTYWFWRRGRSGVRKTPFTQQWLPGKWFTVTMNEGLCSIQEKHLLSWKVSQLEYLSAPLRILSSSYLVSNYMITVGMLMHTELGCSFGILFGCNFRA